MWDTLAKNASKFCGTGSAGERDNVPYVLHTCYKEYQTLKAKAETGVRA